MTFSWNGWHYYTTPKGKLKKFQSGQKVQNCSEEEYQKAAESWAKVFRDK